LQSDDVTFFENKINGKKWTPNNGQWQQRDGEDNGGGLCGNILRESNGLSSVTYFPPAKNDATQNGNEQSLMIKVTYGGKNILFPGD
jgi:hypothetical protein